MSKSTIGKHPTNATRQQLTNVYLFAYSFEFQENIDLSEYLQKSDPPMNANYTLHGVLVHSGDNHGGHYVVFINPKGDGRWCKFDDDVVSRCTKAEAIDHNFGGNEDDVTVKQCTNAYMLVYIRDDVLDTVTEEDIPDQLIERLQEEKRQEALRRKERNEAHLYMNIQVYTEDSFMGHKGNDLFDAEKATSKMFKVKKQSTLKEAMEVIAEQMKYPLPAMRIWPIISRANETMRPSSMDTEAEINRTVVEVCEGVNPWQVYLELVRPDSGQIALRPIDRDSEFFELVLRFVTNFTLFADDVLLFFKLYDPKTKVITYCCHEHLRVNLSTKMVLPILNRRAGFPEDTPLELYEVLTVDLLVCGF